MTSDTSAGTASKASAAGASGAPSAPPAATPDSNGLVNNAVYVHGKKVETPHTLTGTFGVLKKHPDGFAWIGLYRPDAETLGVLASQFGLHELAVEDAVKAHQRPKLERYGDTLFMVLKAARYNDARERVEFGELNVFAGPNFVITVRHAESPDLSVVRERMETTPDALVAGPEAVLYAILDAVVDEYAPVVAGLVTDIDEIESQVFGGDPTVSRRIYQLNREVIAFERAVKPLSGIIEMFSGGFADGHVEEQLQQYLRDVADHVEKARERIEEFRVLLRDILAVNTSLVAQRQTEEAQRLSETSNEQAVQTRKISGWAAILFAPTLIGSVYGMNFAYMPELDWRWGYPLALSLMAASSLVLYYVFKRKGWL